MNSLPTAAASPLHSILSQPAGQHAVIEEEESDEYSYLNYPESDDEDYEEDELSSAEDERSAKRDAEAAEYEVALSAAIERQVDALQDAVIVCVSTLQAACNNSANMETVAAAISQGTDLE